MYLWWRVEPTQHSTGTTGTKHHRAWCHISMACGPLGTTVLPTTSLSTTLMRQTVTLVSETGPVPAASLGPEPEMGSSRAADLAQGTDCTSQELIQVMPLFQNSQLSLLRTRRSSKSSWDMCSSGLRDTYGDGAGYATQTPQYPVLSTGTQ